MIRPTRTLDRVLGGILIWCIYSFKFVLIGVGETGIRSDDLLIFLAFVLLLIRGDFRRIKRSRALNIYFGFIGVSFFSAIWNSIVGRVDLLISMFFVARLIQYCIFYYLGYLIAERGINLSKTLSYFLATLCFIVPLQMLGVVPVPGAFVGITTRAVGNTNGPYEMAVVAAFLMCYLGYGWSRPTSGVLSAGLVILSASRITFVATTISLMYSMAFRSGSKRARLIPLVSIVALGLIVFIGYRLFYGSSKGEDVSIVGRLSSAVSGMSGDILAAAYRGAPTYAKSKDYIDGQFASAIDEASTVEADQSGLQRLFRWTTLIKSTSSSTDSTVLGLGPSFGSAAVDGYFVRLIIETGLLGLFMFGWFVRALLVDQTRSSWPFRQYVFIMLFTACFIDIFVSYKPMLLLWMWHGMLQVKRKTKVINATNALKAVNANGKINASSAMAQRETNLLTISGPLRRSSKL